MKTGLEPLIEKIAYVGLAGMQSPHASWDPSIGKFIHTNPFSGPAAGAAAAKAPATGLMAGLGKWGRRAGLGLGAAALGGTIYGLYNQNQQDQKRNNLVYSPSTGAF